MSLASAGQAGAVVWLFVLGSSALPTLEEVYHTNEAFRGTVTASAEAGGVGWMDPARLNDSVFGYGLTHKPRHFLPRLAKPVGPLPIEHDLLCYLSSRVHAASGRLEYLEIGVSVLKSFDTQLHLHDGANLTAFDIEDPNWSRARRWGAATTVRERSSVGFRKTKGKTFDRVYEWPRVIGSPPASLWTRSWAERLAC